jgi:4-amino-4-deoxy-L-arabinose transferase-like glycosyltransferase
MPQIYHSTKNELFYQSPYLYLYTLAGMFRLFGTNEVTARLVGIISGLISIILVFLIVKLSYLGEEYGRLRLATIVSGLYALAPTTIQGSAIINIDNTLLVPAVLFIFLSVIMFFQKKNFIWLCFVSFAVMLSLWLRLSTPLILIFLLILYTLMNKNILKIKIEFLGALIFGFLFFLASWFIYCHVKGAPFAGPFRYTFEAFYRSHGHLGIRRLLQDVVSFACWLGFFPLLSVIFIMFKNRKFLFKNMQLSPHFIPMRQNSTLKAGYEISDFSPGGYIFLCAILLIAGYTLLGGTTFGYPRYHSPAIPLLYIGAGLLLSEADFQGLGIKNISFLFLLSLILQLFVLGDLLYVFRYALRAYAAFMTPAFLPILKEALFRIIIYSSVYALFFLFSLRLFSRKAITGLLIIFSAASSLGMTFLQSSARYNTGYNYGEWGMAEAAKYIKSNIPYDSIVAGPEEMAYYMRLPNSPYLRGSFWGNRDKIERSLRDPRVSAFVYSIATHEIGQIKRINSDISIRRILERDFTYTKIGTYNIWIRIKQS